MNLQHKKASAKWRLRYMQLAETVSHWSKHPDVQVGAVAVGDFGQILSTGYNGWPRGVVNEEDGRVSTNDRGFSYTIHAEANLIYNANLTGTSLRGCSVYIYPVMPCFECAKSIVQVGISEVVYVEDEDLRIRKDFGKWRQSWALTTDLFKEVGIIFSRIN